jgi:DNA-binding NarL/FixJ family response regulator
MPLVNGPELVRRLMSAHPNLKVLYLSGYMDESVARHGVCRTGDQFLQKPFTPAALAQKVRDVLDRAEVG